MLLPCLCRLFYASAKFPEEDAYSKWVSDHGGFTNAWTSAENTNYQFAVNWDHLHSTLDRFAQVRAMRTRSCSTAYVSGSVAKIIRVHWVEADGLCLR
jgi:Insulinase (Peptidase family M16)